MGQKEPFVTSFNSLGQVLEIDDLDAGTETCEPNKYAVPLPGQGLHNGRCCGRRERAHNSYSVQTEQGYGADGRIVTVVSRTLPGFPVRLPCTIEQGAGLPPPVIQTLQRFFSYDIGNIRMRNGVPLVVGLFQDAAAFTFKDRIFFAPGAYDPNNPRGLALIAHEALHCQQFGEDGILRFCASYVCQYLQNRIRRRMTHRAAYRAISYEVEARSLEKRVEADLEELLAAIHDTRSSE